MRNDKKYKLSVPIPLVPFMDSYVEEYLKLIKKIQADRVFLFAPPLQADYVPNLEQYKIWSGLLKEQITLFGSQGYDVAFWMGHTIGHGGSLSIGNSPLFQQLVGVEGKEAAGCYCPMDAKFRDYICSALAIMAESGVELIMLDDDFRINLHPPEVTWGCFCPLHMKAFRDITGKNLLREDIIKQVICGRPNDIRKKWLELNGKVIMNFADEIAHAVHRVNKKTRVGLATAMTMWSNEGVDMQALMKCFAQETQPFLRTIGAPYWSKEPANISWVIEYTRLQKHWAQGWDIELMAEGDSYPHTRYHCPSSALHAFQQGLFASGFTNILNYSLVYAAKPDHERGYIDKISESLDNYNEICNFFPENYVSSGVTPVIFHNNMMNTVMPERPKASELSWPDEPRAVRFLSRLGIPIAYEGGGAVFLSGYGAAGLPEHELEILLSRGAVIDSVAARWMIERGVDIGIKSIVDEISPVFENYTDWEYSNRYFNDNILLCTSGENIYTRCEVSDKARIISEFKGVRGGENFPAAFLYENDSNQRFCVYTFSIYHAGDKSQLLYNYARQEQLTRCIGWVNRKTLTVSVNGLPDVHVICRICPEGKRIAIAIQNCHLDIVKNPVLRIDPQIKIGESIELIPPDGKEILSTKNFEYRNDGNYGYLNLCCEIPPMGMLGVGLKK